MTEWQTMILFVVLYLLSSMLGDIRRDTRVIRERLPPRD